MFVKELHAHTANVNEINDETTELLIEMVLAVNKLQTTSKMCKTLFARESKKFVCDLSVEIFKLRRYIVCCICHVINSVEVIK